jgi:hypothetical protein
MQYLVGCDLGQAHDYTALAVLVRDGDQYHLRHLERFRDRPYPAVVVHVGDLMAKLAAADDRPQGVLPGGIPYAPVAAALAVDATGVGRPVCDLFRAARMPCQLVAITITGGQAVTGDGRGGFHVPKKDLVACAQVLLQARRLRVARELDLADVLVQELENFRVRITPAANEVFGEWREGQHDDLVFALALAAWVGENWPEEYTGPVVYNQWASGPGATPGQADRVNSLSRHLRENLGIDPDGEWD